MYEATTRAVAIELVARGRTRHSVARDLNISWLTLNRWIADPRGASAGARPCPAPVEPNPEYAALLGYYLGDGYISRFPRYFALRISCDARQTKIVEDVESILRAVNPGRPTCRVRSTGCINVQSNWKHWPCLFPQHGPGRKHERTLTLEPWQRDVIETYTADFLRGLFHSDGSLVKNWATRVVAGQTKRYDYPRWQFVNESRDIMQWCGEALDLVDIRWRQTKPRVLSVSRRADVARLTELIGPKS